MKIIAFPKDKNPYQSLLYGAMQKLYNNFHVSYCYYFPIVGVLPFWPFLIIKRFFGYKIVHIHWPTFTLGLPAKNLNRWASYYTFIVTLWLMRALKYKTVWTIHNVIPHEPQTSNDLYLAKKLSKTVDAKILHSSFTANKMKLLHIENGCSTVIPHGNYAGVYPNKTTKRQARKKLGIGAEETVILFFGMIRQYKGIEELAETFVKTDTKKVRLVIAGNCVDQGLKQRIESYAKKPNIDFYQGHVDDKDVAKFFRACDIVCLPFRSITTSGSVMLALTFGKPVIAPAAGALQDLPKGVGYLYNPQEKAALEKSIKQALRSKNLPEKGTHAKAYARTLSWDKIAADTYKVYADVLSR